MDALGLIENTSVYYSKFDVPFKEAHVNIHIPTGNEVALLGDDTFLSGYKLLLFSKDNLSEQDKLGLFNESNFDIFMQVINSSEGIENKESVLAVLTLFFPQYEIEIGTQKILLQLEDFSSSINQMNFEAFQETIRPIFTFRERDRSEFKPADGAAQKIANKLKARNEKLAKMKGGNTGDIGETFSILEKYVTILSVGLGIPFAQLMECKITQIQRMYHTFRKKVSFDFYVSARLAGAQDMEEVENWM